jgi:aspartyl-tRNA synthetase
LFYALPQSPQQFKQILMVAGVEKYFQLARCYRDEDLRADRQPEFTQIDIEMSFIEREDIYALIEGLLQRVWKTALNIDVPVPFKRLTFEEALNRYGIDKPDTRIGMELADLTEDFRASKFKVFSGAVAAGGVVKALNAKGLACATQGQIETMTEYAKSFGAKGLAYIKAEGGEWKSPIVKFFNDAEKAALTQKLKIEEGDLILFAADQWLNACEILGKIRLYCADVLKTQGKLTMDPNRFDFLWVIEFPLLGFDREQNRWYSSHHPFTAPVAEDIPMLKTDPKKVRGQHYDIVVNGVELGGGSIRIHQPDVQKTVFEEVLQIPPEIWLHAGGVSFWRATARRHRARLRPADCHSLQHGEHPRRHCISKNRQGHLFDDRLARQRGAETTARPASGIESGEEGITFPIFPYRVKLQSC